MKKTLAIMLSLVLTLMTMTTTFAASDSNSNSFSDISNSYAKDAIMELQSKGILSGVDADHFDPKGKLTRAQFVAIMVLSLGLETTATTSSFTDVPNWAIPYVEVALKAGIISGVGHNKFAPNTTVTREMAVVILVRSLQSKGTLDENATLDFTDADSISDWAKNYIAIALKNGLIKGNPDGTFNPKGIANREMAAVMGVNLLTAIDTVINPAPPTPIPTPTPSPAPEPNPIPSPTPTPSTPPSTGGGGGGGGGYTGGGGGTPTPVAVTGVTVDHATMTLTSGGDTGTLVATVAPINAANKAVVWSSNDNNVATVADGVVTPVATGVTTITVTTADGNLIATCNVTVNPVVEEPETLLSGPTLTVYADNVDRKWGTYQPNTVFQANVNFSSRTLKDFKAAKISLYGGNNVLLATNIARPELFTSDATSGVAGLTDLFGIGDAEDSTGLADTNWDIGAYPTDNGPPTKAVFTLTDTSGVVHIAEAPITIVTPVPLPDINDAATLSVDNNGLLLNFSINKEIDLSTTKANVQIAYFIKEASASNFTPISNTSLTGGNLVKDKSWEGYLWDVVSGGNYSQGIAKNTAYSDKILANTELATLVKYGYHAPASTDMNYVSIDWTIPATYQVEITVTDNSGNTTQQTVTTP